MKRYMKQKEKKRSNLAAKKIREDQRISIIEM